MNDFLWIAPEVLRRRLELGLTQTALAQIAGISRATVNGLERGQLKNLSLGRLARLLNVIGLKLQYEPSRESTGNIVDLAAQMCSVSYSASMPPLALSDALITGQIPKDYEAHFITLLDELPMPIVVRLVEAVAAHSGQSPSKIWKHLGLWATTFDSPRMEWHGL
jgi:transcriptional regulator with XRE-family HTH domain